MNKITSTQPMQSYTRSSKSMRSCIVWPPRSLVMWSLSDTGPGDYFDNEDDGILNAFTTTENPTEGIVEDVNEEEELVESKFEKIDE